MRPSVIFLLSIAALLVAPFPAHAVQPDEILANPAQEERARALSRELRCMVCQNQSIDDSDAPLARDLRLLVRERIKSGDSDAQVMNFLVERYGSFVLLKPRFELQTLALWLLPPFALIVGALVLFMQARRRRMMPAASADDVPPLSANEQATLQRLLNGREPDSPNDFEKNHSITNN